MSILSVGFDAAVISLLLYVFARHNAEKDYTHVLLACIGIAFGDFLIAWFLTPYIGVGQFVVAAAFTIWMLMQFCYTTFIQTLQILGTFIVIKIIWAYLWGALMSS